MQWCESKKPCGKAFICTAFIEETNAERHLADAGGRRLRWKGSAALPLEPFRNAAAAEW